MALFVFRSLDIVIVYFLVAVSFQIAPCDWRPTCAAILDHRGLLNILAENFLVDISGELTDLALQARDLGYEFGRFSRFDFLALQPRDVVGQPRQAR